LIKILRIKIALFAVTIAVCQIESGKSCLQHHPKQTRHHQVLAPNRMGDALHHEDFLPSAKIEAENPSGNFNPAFSTSGTIVFFCF